LPVCPGDASERVAVWPCHPVREPEPVPSNPGFGSWFAACAAAGTTIVTAARKSAVAPLRHPRRVRFM
jgi:hypothetical protein